MRYFTGIIRDITREMELEKIKESHIQITAEVQGKNELLATVSHEFRTPLQAVMSYTEALLQGFDGPLLDKQKTSLEAIYKASEHLFDVVSQMLHLANLIELPIEEMSIPASLESILNDCVTTVIPLAKKKGLTIVKNLSDGLILPYNQKNFREIFINLLSNAIKYTEKGTITVSLTSSLEEIIVRITDTGCGIDKENLSKIFIPFHKISGQSMKEHCGLGLAITKRLVELCKATIEVQSEKGVGSTFTVRIPLSTLKGA